MRKQRIAEGLKWSRRSRHLTCDHAHSAAFDRRLRDLIAPNLPISGRFELVLGRQVQPELDAGERAALASQLAARLFLVQYAPARPPPLRLPRSPSSALPCSFSLPPSPLQPLLSE